MVHTVSIPYTAKKRIQVREPVAKMSFNNKNMIQKAMAMLPTSPAKHFAFFLKLKNRNTKLASIG